MNISTNPRDKLLKYGIESLTNYELLALIIISGTPEINVIDISKQLLSTYNNSLNKLFTANLKQLNKSPGIGLSKACSLLASFEISRRKSLEKGANNSKVNSSQEVYNYLKPNFSDLQHEEFRILLLNRNNRVIRNILISKGGVSGTVVDPRIVFKYAVEELASGVILSHNHPSGNIQPSKPDIDITKKLVKAGDYFDIKVLDHLIVCDSGYYSFADEGII